MHINIISILKNNLFKIIFSIILFGLLSIYIAKSFDNIYESKSLLHATESPSSNSRNISLPVSFLAQAPTSENSLLASQMLISRDFFEILYENHNFSAQLMAYGNYDGVNLTDNFNASMVDIKTLKWKIQKPPVELAHRTFLSNHFLFLETSERGFFKLVTRHQSPQISKQWNELIIKEINIYVASYKNNSSKEVLSFLLKQFELEKNSIVKTSMQNLITNKYQDLALTNKSDYVFSTVSKPFVPIKKSSPNRALICFAITFMGFIFTLFVIILRETFTQLNK